jgi:hypothetical protein
LLFILILVLTIVVVMSVVLFINGYACGL